MSVPAIRTTRIPRRLISAESQARGEPVKKASYERSKNAWRTCDLRMPQGTTRTQPASPSFLCLLLLSPLPPFTLPFVFLLPLPSSDRFLATRSRSTASPSPSAASESKPHRIYKTREFTNGHVTLASFRCNYNLLWNCIFFIKGKSISLNFLRNVTAACPIFFDIRVHFDLHPSLENKVT